MTISRRTVMKLIAHSGAATAIASPALLTTNASAAETAKPLHLLHGTGLHHVNIRVRDMDKAIAFYEEAFRFPLLFRWDGVEATDDEQVYFRNPLEGAHLDMGDGQILEIIPAPEGALPPDELASRFNHIGLRVSDLEATYEQALAAGAKPYPIEDGVGGVWEGPTEITLKAKPPFERSFVVRAAHVPGTNDEVIELFEA